MTSAIVDFPDARILIVAGVVALLGLWCLVAPPRAMLAGMRWQLRNGDRAEPSAGWILYTRISGGVLVVGAVVLTIWFFVGTAQATTRASLGEAWGLRQYSSASELKIELNPEVEHVPRVEETIAGYTGAEQGLRVWRSAIVGRDPVGDLGAGVAEGDLILAVRDGSCRPGPVLVTETDAAVTVSVTGTGLLFRGEPIPCGARDLLLTPNADDLLIVRVPLERPVGDRELILPDPPERAPSPR